jgi:hypothetical protein
MRKHSMKYYDSMYAKAKHSPSIPMPGNHIHRTESELQMEHETMVAQWREGQMYERILRGMLRRCNEVGCHPKTRQSLIRIAETKVQESLDASPVAAEQESKTHGRSESLFEEDDEWILGDISEENDDSSHHANTKQCPRGIPACVSTSYSSGSSFCAAQIVECGASEKSSKYASILEDGVFEFEL